MFGNLAIFSTNICMKNVCCVLPFKGNYIILSKILELLRCMVITMCLISLQTCLAPLHWTISLSLYRLSVYVWQWSRTIRDSFNITPLILPRQSTSFHFVTILHYAVYLELPQNVYCFAWRQNMLAGPQVHSGHMKYDMRPIPQYNAIKACDYQCSMLVWLADDAKWKLCTSNVYFVVCIQSFRLLIRPFNFLTSNLLN